MTDEDFDRQIGSLMSEWEMEGKRHADASSRILERLVNLITSQISSASPPTPSPEPIEPVPYRSQWDADAGLFASDCGPACVSSLLAWRDTQATVDDVALACGMSAGKKYTNGPDLVRAFAKWGVGAESVTGKSLEYFVERAPCIVLVHYETLPRMDTNYLWGHWVVVLGVRGGNLVYHDPDWKAPRRDEGASRAVPVDVFKKAMADCAKDGNPPGYGVVLAEA